MKKRLTGVLIFIAVASTAMILPTMVPFATCPGCSGKGELSTLRLRPEDAFWTEPCSECNGRGRLTPRASWSLARRMRPCTWCEGSGVIRLPRYHTWPCEWCGETGRITDQRQSQIQRYREER
jgi:hypothetical protein